MENPLDSNLIHGNLSVSINVSHISPRLPPAVAQGLAGFSTQVEFPYFKTKDMRVLSSKTEFDKEVEILQEWVEEKFPSCFLPSYPREVAQHVVSYLYCGGPPDLHPGSTLFRKMTKLMFFGFFFDDLIDKDQGQFLREEYAGVDFLGLFDIWKSLEKMFRRFGISDGGAIQRATTTPPPRTARFLFSMVHLFSPISHFLFWKRGYGAWVKALGWIEYSLTWFGGLEEYQAHKKLLYNPVIYHYVAATMDVMRDTWVSAEAMITLQYSMLPVMFTNRWANAHMSTSASSVTFCDETYRFFRSEDTGLFVFLDLLYLYQYGYLPRWIYHSAGMRHYQILASYIFAGINDILGFERDVRDGEFGSVVMFHLLNAKGKGPKEVLQSEVDRLGGYVKDYLWFRSDLLATFGDDVTKYVATVDSVLNGCVQAFLHSKRYAMGGGRIEFKESGGLVKH